MIKTLVFDFDGTLADTRSTIVKTMRETFDAIGAACPDEEAVARLIGLPLDKSIEILLGNSDAETVDKAVACYHILFERNKEGLVRPFPHVVETIEKLKENGLTLTVASSRGRDSLKDILGHFGIAHCFAAILGFEDVTGKKPAPDMVLEILRRTNAAASETLVVGDTTFDIEMGQRAHCLTCGVTYGNHTAEQLMRQGADYIIGDFGDLERVVFSH